MTRPKLRLVTISPSHYCEKARWALDRAGERYREERHAPLFHMAATYRASGTRTVPILVTPHEKIADSTEILRHVDRGLDPEKRLFPHEAQLDGEVSALEEMLDAKLGPKTRSWAYAWLLPERDLFVDLMDVELPRVERALFRASVDVVRAAMRRAFPQGDAAKTKGRERIEKTLGEVSARLADGRKYLVGDRLTAADVTFAALAAPCILPPEYGTKMPDVARIPEGMRRDVDAFRATPAGAHALWMYREERWVRA